MKQSFAGKSQFVLVSSIQKSLSAACDRLAAILCLLTVPSFTNFKINLDKDKVKSLDIGFSAWALLIVSHRTES
jgi:hypothetical protein